MGVGGGGKSEFGLYGGVGGMMVIAGLAYNEIGSRGKCRDGDFCYGDRPQESIEKLGFARVCPQRICPQRILYGGVGSSLS